MDKQRKTDRRTLYTRQLIKDIFLEELSKKSYSKLSVQSPSKTIETVIERNGLGVSTRFFLQDKKVYKNTA